MKYNYKKLNLEKIKCPICSSEDFEVLSLTDRNNTGLRTVGCNNCSLIFTNPRPNEADINEFYKTYYRSYYQSIDKPTKDYIRKYKKDHRALYHTDFILNAIDLKHHSNILDFGCSDGSLLKEFSNKTGKEYNLFGVELGDNFRSFASHYSGAKIEKEITDFNDDTKFDLITLIHVFEHIPNPIDFLELVIDRVKKNGYIYIDVPSVMDYKTISDIHFAHLVHYSKTTLENTFKILGLKIVSLEVHEPPGHPKSILCLAQNKQTSTQVLSSNKKSFLVVKDLTKRKFLNSIIHSPIYGAVRRLTPNFVKIFLKR